MSEPCDSLCDARDTLNSGIASIDAQTATLESSKAAMQTALDLVEALITQEGCNC